MKKTSPVNSELSAIHELDRLLNTGKGALNIVDTNGTMYLKSGNAYITKRAEVTLGKGMSTVSWTFKAPNCKWNTGHNL